LDNSETIPGGMNNILSTIGDNFWSLLLTAT